MLKKISRLFRAKKELFTFLLILFLGTFLRFWRVQDLFVFSGDEEHQMSLAYSIVKNFHIEWVGVSSADTGFYLGPFWIYFGSLWLFISNGNPLILSYIAAGLGVVTLLVLYVTGRVMFGERVAAVGTLLYSSLPLLVFYDKKFWNPALTSLTSVSLLLSLYLTKFSKYWWLVVFSLCGFILHVHLSLIPLILIAFFYFSTQFRKVGIKLLLLAIFLFLLIISPILGFDYFTKGENIKTPARVFNQVSQRPSRFEPLNHIRLLTVSLGRLWYVAPGLEAPDQVLHICNPNYVTSGNHTFRITTDFSIAPGFLGLASIILLAWFFVRKKTWVTRERKMLALFVGTIVFSYIFLPNIGLEYYLLGVFPLVLFVLALLLGDLPKKFRDLFVVGVIVVCSLGVFSVLTSKGNFGLSLKRELISEVSKYVGDRTYEVNAHGLCHKYEGWRFLFRAYGKPPEKSFTDETLGWIYPTEIKEGPVDYLVEIYEDRIVKPQKAGFEKAISRGGYTAYIYKMR